MTRGRRVLLAVLVSACSPPPPPSVVSVVLTALDPLDAPVPAVTFWIDGRDLGQSDTDGELRVQLSRDVARTRILRHACPADHLAEQPSRQLPLRGMGPTELRLVVRCRPLQQATPLVVVAHTPRPTALPVLVDGQPTDLTDSQGVAHSLLRLRPGQALEVSLDTHDNPALRPRNPARRFVTGPTPEILVFEQRFEPKPPPPRRPMRAPGARATRPHHIE